MNNSKPAHKHFLLAEDDEDDILLISQAIIESNLPISLTSVIYCDGIFKTRIAVPLPHIIIIDSYLPGKSLLQCVQEITLHEKLCDIPIIVMSGAAERLSTDKILEDSVNLFLDKPTEFKILQDIVQRLYYIDFAKQRKITSEAFFEMDISN